MISGAGLDMIDGEWMSNKMEHKLMQYSLNNENLIITPHIGGATYESIYGAEYLWLQNYMIISKVYNFLSNKFSNKIDFEDLINFYFNSTDLKKIKNYACF